MSTSIAMMKKLFLMRVKTRIYLPKAKITFKETPEKYLL